MESRATQPNQHFDARGLRGPNDCLVVEPLGARVQELGKSVTQQAADRCDMQSWEDWRQAGPEFPQDDDTTRALLRPMA